MSLSQWKPRYTFVSTTTTGGIHRIQARSRGGGASRAQITPYQTIALTPCPDGNETPPGSVACGAARPTNA